MAKRTISFAAARKIYKVRKYDMMVNHNVMGNKHSTEKKDNKFKKAYEEFKRKPYGMKEDFKNGT